MAQIMQCPRCGRIDRVEVKFDDFIKYSTGASVMECFPYLQPWERELFISGICPDCWEDIFGEEEDDEIE